MEPISELEALRLENARYKKLAAGELRTNALRRAFDAASLAFAKEIVSIPADEREALESNLGVTIESALTSGAKFTLDGQVIFVKE